MRNPNPIVTTDAQYVRLAREMSDALRRARWQGAYDVLIVLAQQGKVTKWWTESNNE